MGAPGTRLMNLLAARAPFTEIGSYSGQQLVLLQNSSSDLGSIITYGVENMEFALYPCNHVDFFLVLPQVAGWWGNWPL